MKKYFKVYLITVLISGICIGLPWLIDLSGFHIGIDAIEILEWQGVLSGLIGLAIAAVYVIRNVKTWLPPPFASWTMMLAPLAQLAPFTSSTMPAAEFATT